MPSTLTPPAPSVQNLTDPPEPPTSLWLKPRQAATVANVGVRTIYKAVAAKQLRATRINGRHELRIHVSWIQAWLEAGAEP